MIPTVKVKGDLTHYFGKVDLTKQLLESADLVSQEIRGNVKKGLDFKGRSLLPNTGFYAQEKMNALGHVKPLIAEHKMFTKKSSYTTHTAGINKVEVKLSNANHPDSNSTIAEIGAGHNYALGQKKREFFGVTDIAKKRVQAKILDEVFRLVGNKFFKKKV